MEEMLFEEEQEGVVVEEGGSAIVPTSIPANNIDSSGHGTGITINAVAASDSSLNKSIANGNSTPGSAITVKPLLKGRLLRASSTQIVWEGFWGMGSEAFLPGTATLSDVVLHKCLLINLPFL